MKEDDNPVLAGIDIGGTTTQAILVDPELRILARSEALTPALESGAAMAATAASLVQGLAGGRPVLGVGVGAAGVVDAAEGRILVACDSFIGWSGFPLAATLSEALGAPTFVDNDVNAFLRGEISTGAIQGVRDALGMTLGTGVGGAIWLDGQLFDGPTGVAGEIRVTSRGSARLRARVEAGATSKRGPPGVRSRDGGPTSPVRPRSTLESSGRGRLRVTRPPWRSSPTRRKRWLRPSSWWRDSSM